MKQNTLPFPHRQLDEGETVKVLDYVYNKSSGSLRPVLVIKEGILVRDGDVIFRRL